MTEALTLTAETTAEPTLTGQELGGLPVAVTCVFGNCNQAHGVCITSCAGEFTRQPDPLAVLEVPAELSISALLSSQ